MDLAAGDLFQGRLHLHGALRAGEVIILLLGRLGGLRQLFAQGLCLAHVQILRRDLRRSLPHQILIGQPQQDLGVAKAQLATADHTAHILGQGQQAQAVGHGAAALAQLFRGRFLR